MKIAVVLHNIRSLHNVGSIFRTADAAGLGKIHPHTRQDRGVGVYLCGITPKPTDRFGALRPQFAKVALGAEKYVPWEYARRTRDVIKKLRGEGYKIFAVEQGKKSVPYYKVEALRQAQGKNQRYALIFGNEVRGIPPSILKLADKILEIPMRGRLVRQAHHPRHRRGSLKAARHVQKGKESLNVSVAFGIVVFHLLFVRKRER